MFSNLNGYFILLGFLRRNENFFVRASKGENALSPAMNENIMKIFNQIIQILIVFCKENKKNKKYLVILNII